MKCLSDQQLESLFDGSISSEELASMDEVIDSCDDCRQVLALCVYVGLFDGESLRWPEHARTSRLTSNDEKTWE